MTKLIGIVAVDAEYGIGNEGKVLPFDRADMRHFHNTVKGQVFVCSGATYKQMRKGFGDAFVHSRTPIYYASAKVACSSARYLLNRALSTARQDNRDVYLCGGTRLYELFRDEVDEWVITRDMETYVSDTKLPWIHELLYGGKYTIVLEQTLTPTLLVYRVTKNVDNVTNDVV